MEHLFVSAHQLREASTHGSSTLLGILMRRQFRIAPFHGLTPLSITPSSLHSEHRITNEFHTLTRLGSVRGNTTAVPLAKACARVSSESLLLQRFFHHDFAIAQPAGGRIRLWCRTFRRCACRVHKVFPVFEGECTCQRWKGFSVLSPCSLPQLDAIATVGSTTWLGSWWAGLKHLINPLDAIQEGYEKASLVFTLVTAFMHTYLLCCSIEERRSKLPYSAAGWSFSAAASMWKRCAELPKIRYLSPKP